MKKIIIFSTALVINMITNFAHAQYSVKYPVFNYKLYKQVTIPKMSVADAQKWLEENKTHFCFKKPHCGSQAQMSVDTMMKMFTTDIEEHKVSVYKEVKTNYPTKPLNYKDYQLHHGRYTNDIKEELSLEDISPNEIIARIITLTSKQLNGQKGIIPTRKKPCTENEEWHETIIGYCQNMVISIWWTDQFDSQLDGGKTIPHSWFVSFYQEASVSAWYGDWLILK